MSMCAKPASLIDSIAQCAAEANDRLEDSRLTILVVDDEPGLADIAGELLNFYGIDAVIAYSAQQALAFMKTRTDIDAIFSDVTMPGMSGLELAEIISDLYPSVKIVLASGYTSLSERQRHARYFPVVAKPYSIETVIRHLKS